MYSVNTGVSKMAVARRAENSAPRGPGHQKASLVPEKPKKRKAPASKIYNLRVDDATDRLIDEARAVLGQSRTEFMLTTAKVRAQEVLLNRTHFVLSEEEWAAFQADLEAPAAPTPELVTLMSRTSLWAR
jgi:uncharacterized protein (DUF1778 family)